jgi:hypothetical protein
VFGIGTIKKLLAGKDLENAAEKVNWSQLKNQGWKTYTGAALIAVGAVLQYLNCDGCSDFAAALQKFGVALGIIGIRHAISKQNV